MEKRRNSHFLSVYFAQWSSIPIVRLLRCSNGQCTLCVSLLHFSWSYVWDTIMTEGTSLPPNIFYRYFFFPWYCFSSHWFIAQFDRSFTPTQFNTYSFSGCDTPSVSGKEIFLIYHQSNLILHCLKSYCKSFLQNLYHRTIISCLSTYLNVEQWIF